MQKTSGLLEIHLKILRLQVNDEYLAIDSDAVAFFSGLSNYYAFFTRRLFPGL